MCDKLQNCYEVFLKCSKNERSNRPNFRDSDLVYELGVPDLELPTHDLRLERCVDVILEMLE